MWYIGSHVFAFRLKPFFLFRTDSRYDARKKEIQVCRSFCDQWEHRLNISNNVHLTLSLREGYNSFHFIRPNLLTNLFWGSLSSFRGRKTMDRRSGFRDVLNAVKTNIFFNFKLSLDVMFSPWRLRWFITHWLIVGCVDSIANLIKRSHIGMGLGVLSLRLVVLVRFCWLNRLGLNKWEELCFKQKFSALSGCGTWPGSRWGSCPSCTAGTRQCYHGHWRGRPGQVPHSGGEAWTGRSHQSESRVQPEKWTWRLSIVSFYLPQTYLKFTECFSNKKNGDIYLFCSFTFY